MGLKIYVNQQAIGRYGISAQHVLDMIEAAGGRRVGEIYKGQRKFPSLFVFPIRFVVIVKSFQIQLFQQKRDSRFP